MTLYWWSHDTILVVTRNYTGGDRVSCYYFHVIQGLRGVARGGFPLPGNPLLRGAICLFVTCSEAEK